MSDITAKCIRCNMTVKPDEKGTLVDRTGGDVCAGEIGLVEPRGANPPHVVVHMWTRVTGRMETNCTCGFQAKSGEGYSLNDEKRRHDESWRLDSDRITPTDRR